MFQESERTHFEIVEKMKIKKILKTLLKTLLAIIVLLFLAVIIFINKRDFGVSPKGERLEKIETLPNYSDGKFHNRIPTSVFTFNDNSTEPDSLVSQEVNDLRPTKDIPVVKTNLKELDKDEDVLVWFGHSSLFMQLDGKRILVDPVLVMASPVSFVNKAFPGTDVYTPDDIPDIDYLIITHNHWDHLDYNTIKQIKDRTGKIICSMGIGASLEYWGVDKNKIIELNWDESITPDNGFTFFCFPTQHFSGRSLTRDKTLWASYLIQSPSQKIYISGDGGYGPQFSEIANQFDEIDLAILENGQYNRAWSSIHLMPEQLVQAAKDLKGKRLMTYHNSKYALASHPWYEPLENIYQANKQDSLNLITPMIGEPVYLKDTLQTFSKWWDSFIDTVPVVTKN